MFDCEGCHGNINIDGHDIGLLVNLHHLINLPGVKDMLGNMSRVNHRILTGIDNVYLPAANRLLKGLSGVDESYLAIICVEVLGDGLVVHMLNGGLCCSGALHTRLYTCELLR